MSLSAAYNLDLIWILSLQMQPLDIWMTYLTF